MALHDADTEKLIELASQGDNLARRQLLARHRDRLRRMVAARLDRRLVARFDPSDVVQEALLDAAQELSNYLKKRPVAFYPWLRKVAWEHLLKLHRRHLSDRRSVTREEQGGLVLPDDSVLELAKHVVAPGTSPINRLLRKELVGRVQTALALLPESDREVLVMRYVEQLAMSEIAGVLDVSEAAVKMRRTRALKRLCGLLGGTHEEKK
jgi:RNA polymerase sigma-70 factor (ECF subfamily)